jgi:hypothetical protein
LRVGLCHCLDCRKTSGAPFIAFAMWPREALAYSGKISSFSGRSFCPACGGRVFNLGDDEIEIQTGSFDDAPGDLVPTYELWIRRREHWLHPLPDTAQYEEDRD